MKCPFCKGDTVPVYVEEAVEKYNSGINALKNYEGTVLVKKRDNVTVKTNDILSFFIGKFSFSLIKVFAASRIF